MPFGYEFDEMSENDLRSALTDATVEDQIEIWRRLGNFAWERSEFGVVTAMAQTQHDLALQNDSLEIAAKAKYTQGSAHFNVKEFAEAKECYLESALLAGKDGIQGLLAEALWAASDSAFSLELYDEMLSLATNSEEIAISEEMWLFAGRSAFLKMKAYYLLDREEEALNAGIEARGHFQKMGAIQDVAKVDDYAITILFFLKNFEEATEVARDVLLKWNIQQDEPEWIAYSNYRLGVALQKEGKFEESNRYLEIGRKKYLEVNKIGRVAECEQEIGSNLFDLDLFEESIDKLLGARALWDGVGNDWGAIRCDATRAVALHMLDKFAEAKKLNLKILQDVEGVDSERYKDIGYLVRARAADNALNDNLFEEVLQILKDGQDLGSFVPASFLVIWRLTLQCRALYALGREDEALIAANSAMDLTNEDLLNWNTGFIYEIRGSVLLHKNRREGEEDLAHAIALHLGNGYTERATELSKIFIPKIQRREVDSSSDIEIADITGEFVPAAEDLKGEVQDIRFGFTA